MTAMRIPRSIGTLAAALGIASLAACGEGPRGPVQVGEAAPEYGAVALEGGGAVSLAELRGKPVLLNVWATWCHPCREELPDLQRLHQEKGPKGLRVVGVSIDERGQGDEVRDFLKEFGVTYAIWLDPAEQVSTTFSTLGVPSTFLIGPDGTLLWKHLGPVKASDPELNRLIDQALAGGGS